MSTRVCGHAQLADPLRPNLEALLRNFDCDAPRSKRLMSQLLEEDREAFLRSAIQYLRTQMDSRGAQHLIGLLVVSGQLLPALSDPAFTRENAMALAIAASRMNPAIDVVLARSLADSAAEDEHATPDRHVRLMEILAVITDGIRTFPSLVRLLRHPNPHIRSKAVLIIGRGNRSAKWVRQRMADTDPRIRANAAEALWGVRTDEARELLQSLVHDSNNRVAGNAVLGMYRLGDCAMIPELVAMAHHEAPLFRATAAWVMGETGDPRFTEILAALLREPNATIRKRAFAALGNIRSSVAQSHTGPRWRLAARLLEPESSRSMRRLLLGAVAEDSLALPDLLPTQILLNEDGRSIVQYRVTERPLPETQSLVFVLPRSGAGPALECLPWKRPSDLWAGVYYNREGVPAAASMDCIPRFQSAAEAIAADWERIPPALACADLWGAIAAAVSMESNSLAGKRRLIVFSEAVPRRAPGDEVISAVAAAQAFVQVISPGRDPVMEEFCRRVNGAFWPGGEQSVLPAYFNLFTRYEVAYQPPDPDAHALKIRLHGPGLCAETRIPLFTSE